MVFGRAPGMSPGGFSLFPRKKIYALKQFSDALHKRTKQLLKIEKKYDRITRRVTKRNKGDLPEDPNMWPPKEQRRLIILAKEAEILVFGNTEPGTRPAAKDSIEHLAGDVTSTVESTIFPIIIMAEAAQKDVEAARKQEENLARFQAQRLREIEAERKRVNKELGKDFEEWAGKAA